MCMTVSSCCGVYKMEPVRLTHPALSIFNFLCGESWCMYFHSVQQRQSLYGAVTVTATTANLRTAGQTAWGPAERWQSDLATTRGVRDSGEGGKGGEPRVCPFAWRITYRKRQRCRSWGGRGAQNICLPSSQGLENVNIFFMLIHFGKNSQIFLYLYCRILTSIGRVKTKMSKYSTNSRRYAWEFEVKWIWELLWKIQKS